jgi:hypothetical protein
MSLGTRPEHGARTPPPDLEVRGAATPEELAAVLAALRLRERPGEAPSRFEQWRRERIRALGDNR